ncbi:MAG: C25 family cysteine peptidase [bacterium]|nr:C25 family cysteine peptidase [bacterium]
MKTWRILCVIAVFLMGISAASADFIPLRADMSNDQPQVQVLRQSATEVQLEIRIPGLDVSSGILDGRRWDRIEIPTGSFSNEPGQPEVPSFSRMVAIPPQSGVRVDFEPLETMIIPDIDLMPDQGLNPEDLNNNPQPVKFDFTAYSQDQFYPDSRVAVSEPALMRGLRLVSIKTNPVTYNPTSKELKVVHRYKLTVHFEGTDLRNQQQRPMRPISRSWAKLMRSLVANFDELDIEEIPMGSYLIVCENDANLMNNLIAPLVGWKRQKGHTVAIQTFAPGASNTTIKNIIQNFYNSSEIPPEFVLLFGDVEGDYALPGWVVSSWPYASNQIDHQYSQLDGSDVLADVAIGRLTAANAGEAQVLVNKVLFYEKMPYTANTDWYHQGAVVAGNSSSGISTVQLSRYIKSRMIEHQFTRVDTFWYFMSGSVYNTTTTAINNGISAYNYRGCYLMENFSVSSIDNLSNGRMMPFVVTITCGTGGFAGSDSYMEHFAEVGTTTLPKGAIAAVGTATTNTHTRQNNTIAYGIFAGLYDEGITQAGNALNRGKLELYNAYQTHDPQTVTDFSQWAALAGDPGLELYNGPIHFMTCSVPDNATWGVNTLALTVNETGVGPLADATVCLYKAGELQSVGLTNANGQITLPLSVSTAGNVRVTVTRQSFAPVVDSLNVIQAGVTVGYVSSTIDDDNSGSSSGDGDGRINPGETVQIPSVFKNYGTTTTATGISAVATVNDPYATLVNGTVTFPNLAPGVTGNSIGDFVVQIAPGCPADHPVRLNLATTSNQGTWNGLIDLTVYSYKLQVLNATASGADTLLGPGETANFSMSVKNVGDKNAASLTANITSLSNYVTVNDNIASFGTINIGATGNCASNPFNLTAAANTPPGQKAHLKVVFSSSTGATQTDTITIQLGPKTQADPQGPDEYGYYCFDDTDFSYSQRPAYSWVEIDPDYGGSGNMQPLYDSGENQDASINVNLGFTFRYYGEDVTQITVCSNGWISTYPNTSYTDFRNYPIPGAIGPRGMIAPFWDDLKFSSSDEGRVYTYRDVANHRFIIEWSRVKYLSSPQPIETFEIILYDQAFVPTPTGDGEIVFQYNNITEVYGPGDDNPYSSVGIERPDHSDGIGVVYWNTYDDPAAAHLQTGRAYKFTTAFSYLSPGQNLDVNVSAVNPPIEIPANGGSFQYNINVHNLGAQTTFQVWNKVRDAANNYLLVFGPVSRMLPGGTNPSRVMTQTIAGSVPSGTLSFISYIGIYPGTVVDSSYFTITKSTVNNNGPWVDQSFVTGDFFDEYQTVAVAAVPDEVSLNQNYPNPFNPATMLSFSLPERMQVKLNVYDISGRLVASLVNGWRDAGTYEALWNASGAPSGVYLVRLQAGDYSGIQKVVLLK